MRAKLMSLVTRMMYTSRTYARFREALAMQRLTSSYWQCFAFWTMRHLMHLHYKAGANDVIQMQTFLNEMHTHKFNHTGQRS